MKKSFKDALPSRRRDRKSRTSSRRNNPSSNPAVAEASATARASAGAPAADDASDADSSAEESRTGTVVDGTQLFYPPVKGCWLGDGNTLYGHQSPQDAATPLHRVRAGQESSSRERDEDDGEEEDLLMTQSQYCGSVVEGTQVQYPTLLGDRGKDIESRAAAEINTSGGDRDANREKYDEKTVNPVTHDGEQFDQPSDNQPPECTEKRIARQEEVFNPTFDEDQHDETERQEREKRLQEELSRQRQHTIRLEREKDEHQKAMDRENKRQELSRKKQEHLELIEDQKRRRKHAEEGRARNNSSLSAKCAGHTERVTGLQGEKDRVEQCTKTVGVEPGSASSLVEKRNNVLCQPCKTPARSMAATSSDSEAHQPIRNELRQPVDGRQPLSTGEVPVVRNFHEKERSKRRKVKAHSDSAQYLLTVSDIDVCIKAFTSARSLAWNDPDEYSPNLDKTNLERLRTHLTALRSDGSAESHALKLVHPDDRVFSIFEHGLGVNHCNACFCCNDICLILNKLESVVENPRSGLPLRIEQKRELNESIDKLDCLASCIESVFNASDRDCQEPPIFSVDIHPEGGMTVLKLTKQFESSSDEVGMGDAKGTDQSTLPPYLQGLSEIVEQYASDRAWHSKAQLAAARRELAKLRKGSVRLQQSVFELEDRLEGAHPGITNKAVISQRDHFRRELDRKDAEIAELKERHRRELAELRIQRQLPADDSQSSSEGNKRKSAGSTGDYDGRRSKHYRTSSNSASHPFDGAGGYDGVDQRSLSRRGQRAYCGSSQSKKSVRSDPSESVLSQLSPQIPRNISCERDQGGLSGTESEHKSKTGGKRLVVPLEFGHGRSRKLRSSSEPRSNSRGRGLGRREERSRSSSGGRIHEARDESAVRSPLSFLAGGNNSFVGDDGSRRGDDGDTRLPGRLSRRKSSSDHSLRERITEARNPYEPNANIRLASAPCGPERGDAWTKLDDTDDRYYGVKKREGGRKTGKNPPGGGKGKNVAPQSTPEGFWSLTFVDEK